jgi:predicted anti-sigma-YlaC factor YlaD
MSEIFDTNGHLTDFALQQLLTGNPDELTRLEISEHLSFCDRCTIRYTNLLEQSEWLSPTRPLEQDIMKRVGRQTQVVLLRRYASMAVAACFAIVFWITGIFNFPLLTSERQTFDLCKHCQQPLSKSH